MSIIFEFMTDEKLIQNTINFVKKTLNNAEGGHDWFHIERVYKNALKIASGEDVDLLIILLGAGAEAGHIFPSESGVLLGEGVCIWGGRRF